MKHLAACFLLATASLASAGELRKAEAEFIRLLDRVRPGVVTIVTPEKRDLDLSGVVISSDGVILTLRKALLTKGGTLPSEVPVKLPGAKAFAVAAVIDSDVVTDTALLRLKSAGRGKIKQGTVDVARPGEWVMLVGNSFGSGRESTPSASLGVVSGIVRERSSAGGSIEAIHISALVNPGSTGAPVIGFDGTLLGIVAPRLTAAGRQTIVIPIDRIRAAYLAKSTPGKRAFGTRPAKRSTSKSVARAFGLVMADAAQKGAAVLVGVRATATPEDLKPPPAAPKPPPKGRRRPPPPPKLEVQGRLPAFDRSSGVIVSADGLILCPLRVIGWPKTRRALTVDLMDGTALPADVVAVDERLRVALLRVQRKGLPTLRPAARDSVRNGRFALAIGFPHENPGLMTPQLTIGIISRTGALARLHPAMRALQTDAGIAGGNRGGPLIDIDGRLLGVLLDVNDTNRQGYATKRHGAYAGNAGLGFALPVKVIEKIVPRLSKGIDLKPVLLGVSTIESEKGLRVVRVSAQNSKKAPTAAAQSGLKKDDFIVEMSGQKLRTSAELQKLLAGYTVGDKITIVWTRDGKRMSAEVTLGER